MKTNSVHIAFIKMAILMIETLYSKLRSVLNFDILNLFTRPKMPQMILSFGLQTLILEFENDSLELKLCPAQSSSDPCYTYAAKLHSQNMDDHLTFIFGTIQNLWKYLSFYKERAILIDLPRVEMENKLLLKDYPSNSHQNSEKREVELPISFKLIVLEGIQTILGLKGEMAVDSVEKRLQKALKENDELKQKLSASKSRESQLQVIISEMKKTIEFLESEKQRLIQQELPKKRVHISEYFGEDQQIPIQQANKENLNENEKHFYQTIQNPYSNQNSKKIFPTATTKSDQINLTQQFTEECKVNDQPAEPQRIQNQNHQALMKKPDFEQKADLACNEKIMNNPSQQFNNSESFEHAEGNQSENMQKIVDFARKCFVLVGYTDKGEERKGYVCIVCQKAFKEVSYLEKHLLLRHSDLNASTEEMLGIRLAQYKKKKEMDMKLETAMRYYGAQK